MGVVTALIAVVGTLLGAAFTHYFQRVNADRMLRQSRDDRLRQDLLSAYHDFASAVIDYRHHQIKRWHQLSQNPGAEQQLRHEAYDMRAAANTQLLRIRLLNGDERIVRLAGEAIDAARSIQRVGVDPGTAEDHELRHRAARSAIDEFVRCAADTVQHREPRSRSRVLRLPVLARERSGITAN
ncbi:Uncharacterised protein [Nocardia asteroides]|nr:hypothetical protein SAMN05444423_112119 [Nocardia asteroides]VEG32721.1 Uncharacterised protein [Nocardia asteroides]